MSKRNTIIGWYWMIQYRDSFRISPKSRVSRSLASRFASRSSTRDKKLIPGHIPLNSIHKITLRPIMPEKCFYLYSSKAFYFWYTFLALKRNSLANYLKHFSSAALLEFVQLKWFRILYWSQSTTLFAFCYIYDALFHIYREFLWVTSI
jgi:hypothetical protein